VIWAWSGAAAPASGTWLCETHGSYREVRKKGQRMGFLLGARTARWVLMRPD